VIPQLLVEILLAAPASPDAHHGYRERSILLLPSVSKENARSTLEA
jgi:hypothetical protein